MPRAARTSTPPSPPRRSGRRSPPSRAGTPSAQFLRAGDLAGALFNARDILIHHPALRAGQGCRGARARADRRRREGGAAAHAVRTARARHRAHGLQRFADRARRAHRARGGARRICASHPAPARHRAASTAPLRGLEQSPRAADVGRVQGTPSPRCAPPRRATPSSPRRSIPTVIKTVKERKKTGTVKSARRQGEEAAGRSRSRSTRPSPGR